MADSGQDNTKGLNWADSGKRPTLFGIFHITIFIPLVMLPFVPYAWLLLLLWIVVDQLLVRYSLTLIAAITRLRIWLSGGIRSKKGRRKSLLIKQGKQV